MTILWAYNFFTVSTTAQHFLSQAILTDSAFFYPIVKKSYINIIPLSTTKSSSFSLSFRFPIKIQQLFLYSPIHATYPPISSAWILSQDNRWWQCCRKQFVLGNMKKDMGLGDGELQQDRGELRDTEIIVGTNVERYRRNKRHRQNWCRERQSPKEVITSSQQKYKYVAWKITAYKGMYVVRNFGSDKNGTLIAWS